jgi:transcription elongation factor GreA
MADKQTILTQAGKAELEEELKILKTVKRAEIAEKIKEARDQGDLSENAEYDSAKEEQGKMEARIANIEKMLRTASVIEDEAVEKDYINVGSTVTVFDKEYGEEEEYTIVGSAEADPVKGKISNESPLGLALIGRKEGDEVDVNAPHGIIRSAVRKIV